MTYEIPGSVGDVARWEDATGAEYFGLVVADLIEEDESSGSVLVVPLPGPIAMRTSEAAKRDAEQGVPSPNASGMVNTAQGASAGLAAAPTTAQQAQFGQLMDRLTTLVDAAEADQRTRQTDVAPPAGPPEPPVPPGETVTFPPGPAEAAPPAGEGQAVTP